MITLEARARCCYGRNPFALGQCLKVASVLLSVAPHRTDEEDDLLSVVGVSIDPIHGWYDKAGIRHLYCPEHAVGWWPRRKT